MPGIKRTYDGQTLTPLKTFEGLLHDFAHGDSRTSCAGARKLLHIILRAQVKVDARWPHFQAHLAREEGFPELFSVIGFAAETSATELMTTALSLGAALFSVPSSVVRIAQDGVRRGFIDKDQNNLHIIGLALSHDSYSLNNAALKITIPLVRSGSHARKIWEGLQISARTLVRLLSRRQISGRRADNRTLTIILLTLLLSAPEASSAFKIHIIKSKGFVNALHVGISQDPLPVLDLLFESSFLNVLADTRLAIEARLQYFESSVEHVIKLFDRTIDANHSPHSRSAQRFLSACVQLIARMPGKSPDKVLGTILSLLRPSTDQLHAELSEAILRERPHLFRLFWQRVAPSLEPRSSTKWLASMAFAIRVAHLPAPSYLNGTKQSTHQILDQLLPPALGKQWFTKGLQATQNGLVVQMTATLLLTFLVRAYRATFSNEQQRQKLPTDFRLKVQERIPEAQNLVALLQSSSGGLMTSDSPRSIDGNKCFEKIPVTALSLRLIEIYLCFVEVNVRYDFGKLSHVLVPAKDPLVNAAQSSLLKIISSPLAAFAWPDHFATLYGLQCHSPVTILRHTAETSLEHLFAHSSLFEHSPEEANIWLDALGSSPSAEMLAFLHNNIEKASKKPWLYAEETRRATDTAVSPLLASIWHHMFLAANTHEIVAYLHKVTLRIAVGYDGLEVASAVASATFERCSGTADANSTRLATFTIQSVSILKGTRAKSPINWPMYANEALPLTENVFLGSSRPTASLSTESLLLHAIAADQINAAEVLEHLRMLPRIESNLVRLLLTAASNEQGFANGAMKVIERLAEDRPEALVISIESRLCLNMLGNTVLAPSVLTILGLAASAKRQTFIHSLAPYITRLAELLPQRTFWGQIEHLDDLVAPLLPLFPSLKLSLMIGTLIQSLDLPKKPPVAGVSLLKTLLSSYILNVGPPSHVIDLCSENYAHLLFLHHHVGFVEAGNLLQRGVESSLPTGLLPQSHPHPTVLHLRNTSALTTLKTNHMFKSTIVDPERPSLSAPDARILSAAIYCQPTSRKLFESRIMTTGMYEPAELCLLPLQAYLYVQKITARNPGRVFFEKLVLVQALTRHADISIKTLALETFTMIAEACYQNGQFDFQPSDNLAADFQMINALTLEKFTRLALIGVWAWRSVGLYTRRCLLWLVRRYVEDQNDSTEVSDLTVALTALITGHGDSLAMADDVVMPVLQAIVERRLHTQAPLHLATQLSRFVERRHDATLRLLRQIAAHDRLGAIMEDRTNASALLEFITYLFSGESAAGVQSAIVRRLFRFYGATASITDKMIYALVRLDEKSGGTCWRSLISVWAPPAIRRTSDARGTDILFAIDSKAVYKTGLRILRADNSQPDAEVYDIEFLLPLVISYLDRDRTSYGDFLAMAESNLIGLVVCCLASTKLRTRVIGQRLLSTLANRLEDNASTEQAEFMLIFDHLRAAAVDGRQFPALAAVFAAQCMHAIASPGEDHHYPQIMSFLLQRPTIDLEDVPMLYASLYSQTEFAKSDRRWILELLSDGLVGDLDWSMLKRRRTVDILVALLRNASANSTDRPLIFKVLEAAASIPSAAVDLVFRRGLFRWPVLYASMSRDETLAWLRIIERASKLAGAKRSQRSGRAVNWMNDVLSALESLSPATPSPDARQLKLHIRVLRRISRYACREQRLLVCQLSSALHNVLAREIPTELVGFVHDAVIRCIQLGGDTALLEPAVLLGLASGSRRIREWVLQAIHVV